MATASTVTTFPKVFPKGHKALVRQVQVLGTAQWEVKINMCHVPSVGSQKCVHIGNFLFWNNVLPLETGIFIDGVILDDCRRSSLKLYQSDFMGKLAKLKGIHIYFHFRLFSGKDSKWPRVHLANCFSCKLMRRLSLYFFSMVRVIQNTLKIFVKHWKI